MKKVKVSLKLFRYSPEGKVELARTLVANMTGNSNFVTPVPALTAVTTAANALEQAIQAAQDKAKSKVAVMHVREAELDNLLTQLSLYVENVANNDATKIMSSGLSVKAPRSPVKQPEEPVNLEITRTASEGEVLLKWKPAKRAFVYVVEQSVDKNTKPLPEGSESDVFQVYNQVDIVSASRLLVKGLVSGRRYAFRVYAVGAGGKSAYSAPAIVRAW